VRSLGKRGGLPRESSQHRSVSEGLLSISFRRRRRHPRRVVYLPRAHKNNKRTTVQLTRPHAITTGAEALLRLINHACT